MSRSPLTARSTGLSKPRLLVACSVLVTPRHTAVAVSRTPLIGSPVVHDWSFPNGAFTSGILDEVLAVQADETGRGLLKALGVEMTLPFELLEAYGPI